MKTKPIDKQTTPGEWIVSASRPKDSLDKRMHISVIVASNPRKIIALTGYEGAEDEAESIANAALISIAPTMLDVLITIQEELTTSKKIINLEALNEMLSEVFAKLANEAGEEL